MPDTWCAVSSVLLSSRCLRRVCLWRSVAYRFGVLVHQLLAHDSLSGPLGLYWGCTAPPGRTLAFAQALTTRWMV